MTSISCVPPDMYSQRFANFFRDHVFEGKEAPQEQTQQEQKALQMQQQWMGGKGWNYPPNNQYGSRQHLFGN